MAKRRETNKRLGIKLLALLVLFICIFAVIKRTKLEQEYNKKLAKVNFLEAEIEEEKFESKQLEEKRAYMKTKKFVEEVARDVLGLVYEDEVIFEQEK